MKRADDFALLYGISKAPSESLNFYKSLYKVLDTLSKSLDMARETITILNPL